MKEETEITVLVTCSYEEIDKQLNLLGFKLIEQYEMNDKYMIDSNVNIKDLSTLEILKKCILVRDIKDVKKTLLYKYKEYNSDGDILKQGKIECPVLDIEKAIKFMESINYKELINIYDKNVIYSNSLIELDVQLVNDKYIFIELEARNNETKEELINILNSYKLSFDNTNYFVKKAQIILEENKN